MSRRCQSFRRSWLRGTLDWTPGAPYAHLRYTVTLARRWEGQAFDRKAERAKKHRGHTRLCPLCKERQKASPTP